jgi:nucleolar GTP-binding protein
MNVRNKACEKLLTARIEQKLKSTARINSILNKIHVARPQARDDVERNPYIPDGALEARSYDKNDPDRKVLQRDIEEENGGAGVYQPDYKDAYILEDEEWKKDIIPELLNGKNVYDFIDADIGEKLKALEDEEERLEKEGFYQSEDEMDDSEAEEIHEKAEWIRNKVKLMKNAARSKKTIKNKPVIPRKMTKRTVSQMESHFSDIGVDASSITAKARAIGSALGAEGQSSGMDVVMGETSAPVVDAARLRRRDQSDRKYDGVGQAKRSKAERLAKNDQRKMNRMARAGEADRHQVVSKIRHLNMGKRGIGKTDWR